jgi:hypothetical protein
MKTLTPAYGRDYPSKAKAVEAFNAGKDFILNDFSSPWDGKPISKNDLPAGEKVVLRYGSLRKTAVVTVPAAPEKSVGVAVNAGLLCTILVFKVIESGLPRIFEV